MEVAKEGGTVVVVKLKEKEDLAVATTRRRGIICRGKMKRFKYHNKGRGYYLLGKRKVEVKI